MWRTVIVSQGEKITLQGGNVKVYGENIEATVPLADIYSVVIDNRAAYISVNVLAALAQAGAHVFYCNDKHLPVAVTVPYNQHFQPLAVIKRQFAASQEWKDGLWQAIVRRKIENQAKCLQYAGVARDKILPLQELSERVLSGDSSGCEAAAARKYFSALFGCMFTRRAEDVTNAALNYGYSVLRSSLCKVLVGYGFNCILGIHHHSEQNEFNLADDMMEVFRPVVDLWVDENCENLFENLSPTNRKGLVNLVNVPILFEGKKMRVRNAMDSCVCSLVSAAEKNNPKLLKLPSLLPTGILEEEE